MSWDQQSAQAKRLAADETSSLRHHAKRRRLLGWHRRRCAGHPEENGVDAGAPYSWPGGSHLVAVE